MPRNYRSRPSKAALILVGTVAGLALGAIIAERTGGLDGLMEKLTNRKRRPARRSNGWRGSRNGDYAHDNLDDEFELAPESFAHMHLSDSDDDNTPDLAALNALEDRVLEAFKNDPILVKRDIEIGAVDNSTIELAGTVRSERESRYAATVTRGVPGVLAVVDKLTITGTEAEKGTIGADLA